YSIRPVRSLRDLLYPILISTSAISLAYWLYIFATSKERGPILFLIYIAIWTAYFASVPQAFVHLILPDGKPQKTIWRKLFYVITRFVIASVVLFLMLEAHSILGRMFGVTPD
ncbi:MAG: hypothetical protein ABIG80_01260, partial [Patescibacteria group bacterium]